MLCHLKLRNQFLISTWVRNILHIGKTSLWYILIFLLKMCETSKKFSDIVRRSFLHFPNIFAYLECCNWVVYVFYQQTDYLCFLFFHSLNIILISSSSNMGNSVNSRFWNGFQSVKNFLCIHERSTGLISISHRINSVQRTTF